jgi:hypothetical protein
MTRDNERETVIATTDRERQQTEAAILAAVREIRYGSAEVVIHDSTVVQIERKEKVRFHPPSSKSHC